MIPIAFAIVAFFFVLLLGVPVAYSLLIGSTLGILISGLVPIDIVIQRSFSPTQSFLLLALPFFILAGELLGSGKLGRQLVELAATLVGRFNGGLAQASVVTGMFFGGVSGSAVADASAIGSVLIPWQKREGYPGPFAGAVNAASATLGVIIPPSIPMIVYSSVSNTSVASLFLAGLLPGLLVAISQIIICWLVAKRSGFPRHAVPFSLWSVTRQFLRALPAILMPVLILGSLVTGVATVTEVSVIAAAYALLLRGAFYRDLPVGEFVHALVVAGRTTGIVMLLIMTSSALSWLLTVERGPQQLTMWFLGAGASAIVVILFMNAIMIVVGAFVDMPAAILLLAPVFIPLANAIGMNLIQLGIIMTLNLAIGLFTPPVGTTLYLSSAIAGEKIEKTSRALLPFYVVSFVTLMLVSFVPALTII